MPVRSSARPVTTTGSRVMGKSAESGSGAVVERVWAPDGLGAQKLSMRQQLTTITLYLTLFIQAPSIITNGKSYIRERPSIYHRYLLNTNKNFCIRSK